MHPPTGFDLAKLLEPVEAGAFFRDCWEKQPLHIERGDPACYRGLFSRHDVDSVIAFTRPKFLEPDAFKPGGPPRYNFVQGWLPDDEPFAGLYPDLPEVHRAFGHGKTVILTAMQHRWPAVAAMCRNLEAFFGCPVHTNLYLTPPGAQGFAPHYDTHEVFVLQIDGTKHWRFYGSARELPLPEEKATFGKDELGPPTQEVFLNPGDLLYMPRGHVHEAFTSENASLHLTVGVKVFRFLDLVQQALAELGIDDLRFRQSLPPGLFSRGASGPSLKEQFQELLQVFARDASVEGAVARMTESFVGKLAALPQDYFAVVDAERIGLDTMMERAPGTLCRVVQEGDFVTLHAPGTRIDGPAKIASALQFIARTPRFTPRALPDNLTGDAKLVLVRRLMREKLLTVVNPPADGEPPEQGRSR